MRGDFKMGNWPKPKPAVYLYKVAVLRQRLEKVCEQHERGLITDFELVYAVTEITAEMSAIESLD